MRNSFMSGSVTGSKEDVNRANRFANYIAGAIISAFVVATIIVML